MLNGKNKINIVKKKKKMVLSLEWVISFFVYICFKSKNKKILIKALDLECTLSCIIWNI